MKIKIKKVLGNRSTLKMDKIRDISINEAVLHVLDNNTDEPILNNYQLDINEDSYRFCG